MSLRVSLTNKTQDFTAVIPKSEPIKSTMSQLVQIKALEPIDQIFYEFSSYSDYGDISKGRCSFARAGAGLPIKSKGDFHGVVY